MDQLVKYLLYCIRPAHWYIVSDCAILYGESALSADGKEIHMELFEKQLTSSLIFDGVILHMRLDTVELPNGKSAEREWVSHMGAVCIVPLLPDGRVIVEKQFRYPVGQVQLEIPAGKLDSPDEDHLEAAKRELREETGYHADRWQCLGCIHPAPAYSSEKIWVYLAEDLHRGAQDLDEDEFLEVETVPLGDLLRMIDEGSIPDLKTQNALLRAARLRPGFAS